MISDYDGESVVELELVLRLANVLWRLCRANSIETGLFEPVIEASHKHERYLFSRENLVEVGDLAERRRLFLGAAKECHRLADPPTSALDRLNRYEHMLSRQAQQIVFTLESLRRQASAEPLNLSNLILAARGRRRVRRFG